MKVITPLTIGYADLISSSVPEDDAPAWNAITNYPVGAQVLSGQSVYECVQTPNVNHAPATSPLYWARIAPSNRWAMFDNEISTTTEATDNLSFTVKSINPGGIGLINVTGTLVDVAVRNTLGGDIVYSRTASLDGTVISDWYQYFWEPYALASEMVLLDIPPYPDAHITVTISGSGFVGISHFVAGTVYAIGDTLASPTLGIIDYSRKDVSPSGIITLIKRRFSKRFSAAQIVQNTQLAKVLRVLTNLRATPCVWVGSASSAGDDPLVVFGFYRDFSIDVAYSDHSLCNLEIEGMT